MRSNPWSTTTGPAGGGTLVEYAVGKNGDVFPDGSGKAG
jgi:hypothetical protein